MISIFADGFNQIESGWETARNNLSLKQRNFAFYQVFFFVSTIDFVQNNESLILKSENSICFTIILQANTLPLRKVVQKRIPIQYNF